MAQDALETALGARGADGLSGGPGRAKPDTNLHLAQDGHNGQDAPPQGQTRDGQAHNPVVKRHRRRCYKANLAKQQGLE